jgi:ABC-type ATPase with predicted acetyltransferase domain
VSIIRTIDITTRPSQRLLQACATFGLGVRHTSVDTTRPTFTVEARELHASFRQGDLVLIQGPSGSGKTSLLAELARLAARDGHTVLRAEASAPNPCTPLIDLIDLPLDKTLRTLAHAGLADATMFSRSPYQLSEGERFRLRLSQTLAAARSTGGPITLVIDEFASVLDRATARCLCFALRRFLGSGAHGSQPTVLLATAHDDVREWLQPDHTIEVSHAHLARRSA